MSAYYMTYNSPVLWHLFLKPMEVKKLAQDRSANKWLNWAQCPGMADSTVKSLDYFSLSSWICYWFSSPSAPPSLPPWDPWNQWSSNKKKRRGNKRSMNLKKISTLQNHIWVANIELFILFTHKHTFCLRVKGNN